MDKTTKVMKNFLPKRSNVIDAGGMSFEITSFK